MQVESCCPPRFAKIVLFGLMANYFLARGKETLARYWNNSQTQNINIDFISRYMVRCRSRDSQRIFFYQTGRSFLPKKYLISLEISYICSPKVKERCSSGLRGTPGKRVYPKRVSRVRIPISPQNIHYQGVSIAKAMLISFWGPGRWKLAFTRPAPPTRNSGPPRRATPWGTTVLQGPRGEREGSLQRSEATAQIPISPLGKESPGTMFLACCFPMLPSKSPRIRQKYIHLILNRLEF